MDKLWYGAYYRQEEMKEILFSRVEIALCARRQRKQAILNYVSAKTFKFYARSIYKFLLKRVTAPEKIQGQ